MAAEILRLSPPSVSGTADRGPLSGLRNTVATLGMLGGLIGTRGNPLAGLGLNSTAGIALVLGQSLVSMVHGVLTQLGLMQKTNETINNVIRSIAPPPAA
jgi:hypothetical protein